MLDTLLNPLLSLIIGTLLGGELTRYFYKPKVVIRYKDVTPLKLSSGTFWSLRVENRGRTVATDCIGVISIDEIKPSDIVEFKDADANEHLPDYPNETTDLSVPREQIISNTYFREINRVSLCWAKLGNPDKLEINPGISQSIDVCKYHKSQNGGYFIFPSEDGWRRLRVRIRKDAFSGSIFICPSNEFPTQINFRVAIDKDGGCVFKAAKPKRIWFKRYLT